MPEDDWILKKCCAHAGNYMDTIGTPQSYWIQCLGKIDTSKLDKLLYVIGQGSCVSPILWALLNQLLLTELGEKFDCIRLVSVDGVEEQVRPGESFIDDTIFGVKNDDISTEAVSVEEKELPQSEEVLVEKMQTIIHFFLGLLQVTGGDAWFLICHR
jgi:hypothetical protein